MLNNWKPGDLVSCQSADVLGPCIRWAQRRGGYSFWEDNHVAVLYEKQPDGDWTVLQATAHGVTDDGLLSDITPRGSHEVISLPLSCDRAKFLSYLKAHVGDRYSWLSVLSCAADILLPESVDLRRAGTFMCSGLVANALQYGGFPPTVGLADSYMTMPCEVVAMVRAGR